MQVYKLLYMDKITLAMGKKKKNEPKPKHANSAL